MLYTTTALNSIQDCDTVISNATIEKSNLEFRRGSLLHTQSNSATSSAQLQADLVRATADLAAITLEIDGMPTGPDKFKRIWDQTQLAQMVARINYRLSKKGPVALIEREMDLDDIERLIAAREDVIAQATARKTELLG